MFFMCSLVCGAGMDAVVTVVVDRPPLGSYHPEYKDMYYPINYGYVEGVTAPDGEARMLGKE